ncbi:hypothetical protein N0Y54_31800 [Nostoc punctiforme UO1]
MGTKILESPVDTIWLINYQESLSIWKLMVKMTRTVETQLKNCGLNEQSSSFLNLQQLSMGTNSLVNFQLKITEYLSLKLVKR